MQTIKVYPESLKSAIEAVIKRAEGWISHGGSGECQLYARFDENGTVNEFFFADFAGHSSWEEGNHITHVCTQEWFDILEHEHMGEWLETELEYNQPEKMKNDFIKYLKDNDLIVEDEERPIYYNWDEFERFNEQKWVEFIEEWKEIALEHWFPEQISHVIDRLTEEPDEKWVFDDNAPEAEISA